jgi:para-nitrobenzyl esterase
MATPLAKGLFQRAIGESGGAFGPLKTLAEAEQTGVKFAAGLNATSLTALRKVPPEELLSSSSQTTFPPNVDGWLLPKDVYSIFAEGKQNDVPLLVGSNADEGRSLLPMFAGSETSFIETTRKRFGDDSAAFLKLYPADTYEAARTAYYTSYRDQSFGWQMRTWARMETKTGKSKTFLYFFTRVPPGPESKRYGAFHAAEIAYVFGNLASTRPWEDTDRKLSDVMSSYWVNFAKNGDPNGAGLPKWPAYRESEDAALELGDNVSVRSNINKPALDFFDTYNQKQRKSD